MAGMNHPFSQVFPDTGKDTKSKTFKSFSGQVYPHVN
jgi:hypothetical protein